ncbi:hypothetical protein FB451DRAFT_1264540 [Mycena latifolia]|nr:hypothetical protein FB451DRAFT_1264540 [Mycena latifolia]
MKSFSIVSVLAFATYVAAQANGGPPFDPAGTGNVGNGAGKQFIGGQCLSAADCGSGCCAGPSGICSGVGAQTQAGKTGCGFGGGAASTSPATAAPVAAPPAAAPANVGGPPFDPAGVPNVGNGAGKQFIGGQCLSGADCGSGCCAGPSGICSGPGAQLQAGKTGCGFVAGGATAAPAAAPAPAPAPRQRCRSRHLERRWRTPLRPRRCPQRRQRCWQAVHRWPVPQRRRLRIRLLRGSSGICSGVGAQTQAGKTGCGFVSKRFVSRSRSMLA